MGKQTDQDQIKGFNFDNLSCSHHHSYHLKTSLCFTGKCLNWPSTHTVCTSLPHLPWSTPNTLCTVTVSRTQWLPHYHAHWINLCLLFLGLQLHTMAMVYTLLWRDYTTLSSGFAPMKTRLLIFNLLCGLILFYQTSGEWSALSLYHSPFTSTSLIPQETSSSSCLDQLRPHTND